MGRNSITTLAGLNFPVVLDYTLRVENANEFPCVMAWLSDKLLPTTNDRGTFAKIMKIYSDSHGIRIVGLTCVACSRYGKPPQNNVRLPFVRTYRIHLGRISPHRLYQTNLVRKCLSTSALHIVPFCLRGTGFTGWLYRR